MLRLEEQRERRQKLQGQESRRRLLDHSLRLKMKRQAREQQDELALDMSMLEHLLMGERDEKQGKVTRKVGKWSCISMLNYHIVTLFGTQRNLMKLKEAEDK